MSLTKNELTPIQPSLTIDDFCPQSSLGLLLLELPDPDIQLYNQAFTISEFTLFHKLPPEVRDMIWRASFRRPREVTVSMQWKSQKEYLTSPNPSPIALRINKESRSEALKHYIPIFTKPCTCFSFEPCKIYFSPNWDTVVFKNAWVYEFGNLRNFKIKCGCSNFDKIESLVLENAGYIYHICRAWASFMIRENMGKALPRSDDRVSEGLPTVAYFRGLKCLTISSQEHVEVDLLKDDTQWYFEQMKLEDQTVSIPDITAISPYGHRTLW